MIDSSCTNRWSSKETEIVYKRSRLGYVGDLRLNDVGFRRNMKLEEVMAEFRLNGLDSPFDENENPFNFQQESLHVREHSSLPATATIPHAATSYMRRAKSSHQMREEQMEAALDIPQCALNMPVKYLEQYAKQYGTIKECRFCKSNGEHPLLYNQHRLKDEYGRIECPVLRAFTCPRCNATGDNAHTVKYCPNTSPLERQRAVAMMRSVRVGNVRRRTPHTYAHSSVEPDAAWASVEKKLNAPNDAFKFI